MSTSIRLQQFQSFDEAGAGIDDVRRINLIVGPNNSGKSKILQAMQRLSMADDKKSIIKKAGKSYSIQLGATLGKRAAEQIFPANTHGGNLPGNNWWEDWGRHVIETTTKIRMDPKGTKIFDDVNIVYKGSNKDHRYSKILSDLIRNDPAKAWNCPLPTTSIFISSERDILPEPADKGREIVTPNGNGATNLIRRSLNSQGISREPVEVDLLDDLNRILKPDFHFLRIDTQENEASGEWEIFLEDSRNGWIPLSQCGSGVKSVVLLLTFCDVVHGRKGNPLSNVSIIVEEIENSLHPRTLRHIYGYLDEVCGPGSFLFLSSHSSVCLDFFQGREDVSLTHVRHDNGVTKSRLVEGFNDRREILSSLGIRASEALQSNAVIWVEGPSDRRYLNRWIEILTEGDLREFDHYSVMFYGGALSAHIAMDSSDESDLIQLLRLNVNSAIMIDSDKSAQQTPLSDTKKRLQAECEIRKCPCWITKGRSIENYVLHSFVQSLFKEKIEEYELYDSAWKKIDGNRSSGDALINTKVKLADLICENADGSAFQHDWKERVEEIISFVRRANS